MSTPSNNKSSGLMTPILILVGAWALSKIYGRTKANVTDPNKVATAVIRTGRTLTKKAVTRKPGNQYRTTLDGHTPEFDSNDSKRRQGENSTKANSQDSKESALANVATTVALSVAEMVLARIIENAQSKPSSSQDAPKES